MVAQVLAPLANQSGWDLESFDPDTLERLLDQGALIWNSRRVDRN